MTLLGRHSRLASGKELGLLSPSGVRSFPLRPARAFTGRKQILRGSLQFVEGSAVLVEVDVCFTFLLVIKHMSGGPSPGHILNKFNQ